MFTLRLLLLLQVIGLSLPVVAQKIFIGEEETNRKLRWSDFKGPVPQGSPHHATTSWVVEYKMDNAKIKGDIVQMENLQVSVTMQPENSWCVTDKTNDGLLKHEQLHFDIGILCMREMLRTMQNTVFHRKDFDTKLNQLFRTVLKKYQDMSDQYDRETDHSNNKEAQQRWESAIAGQSSVK